MDVYHSMVLATAYVVTGEGHYDKAQNLIVSQKQGISHSSLPFTSFSCFFVSSARFSGTNEMMFSQTIGSGSAQLAADQMTILKQQRERLLSESIFWLSLLFPSPSTPRKDG